MVFKIIHIVSVVAGIFPVLFFISKGRALNSTLKILLIYACVSMAVELFTLFAPSRARTSAIHNAFTIFEYCSVILVYYLEEPPPRANKLYIILTFGFLAFYGAGFIADSRFHSNNFVGTTAEAFVLCFLSLRYYFNYLDQFNVEITKHHFFWFNIAFMVYFSGVIFVFLFSNLILNPSFRGSSMSLWILHNFLNVLYNIFLTLGIYKWRKSQMLMP